MEPDPLDLPVQKLEFVCRSERPVSFWPWNPRADPFEVLLARALGRPPGGPVLFRVVDDMDACPFDEFELEATLWGRRAVAAADDVRTGLGRLGCELREPVAFEFEEREPFPPRSLRELAEDLPRRARRCTLTLESPLDVPGEDPFDLPAMLEETARRLALFDLEDREDTNGVDPERHTRDTVARARADVLPLAPGYESWGSACRDDEEGTILGRLGAADFQFPRPSAWPWLLALTLGRVGDRRHEGFGAMSLWVQAGP